MSSPQPPAPPAPGDRSAFDSSVYGPPLSPGSIVSFRQRGVQPPGALYVNVTDSIQFFGITALTSTTLNILIRVLLTTGEISIRQEIFTFGSGLRAASVLTLPLPEGFLLSVTVTTQSNTITRGQIYVTGQLVRALLGPGTTFFTYPLFQGYVQTFSQIGWPLGINEGPLSGYGNANNLTPSSPAAGAEISITVPIGAVWELKSFLYLLGTNATAANRQSRVTFDDGANVFFQNDALGNQTASTNNFYEVGPGVQRGVLNRDTWTNSTPVGLRLRAGFRIRTQTPGLQAGDQYSALNLMIDEFLST